MARPDTPILNRLAEVNDGRSAITGEASGSGYLGSSRSERPITAQKPRHHGLPRMPEKDTKNSYAFKSGLARYLLVPKSSVDGK